jgi:hypothetical protein
MAGDRLSEQSWVALLATHYVGFIGSTLKQQTRWDDRAGRSLPHFVLLKDTVTATSG